MRKFLVTLYVLGGILAFGHCWNRDYSHLNYSMEARVWASTAAGLGWPLYVSTVVFEKR